MTGIFSYLMFFVAICQYEATPQLSEQDQSIVEKSASSACVVQHTDCMLKKLKYNTGWKHDDIELRAAKCVMEIKRKRKKHDN